MHCLTVAQPTWKGHRMNMATDNGIALILLVEDNERNARLVSEILQANGYRLVVATDGWQALDAARKHLPQLILMDLQLPGMDGLTVARRLKADPETAGIPIVALTAHAMPEDRARTLDAGCCAYISKPINYRPFVAEIARILSGSLQPA
jgi:CheY-like chemotaxis protein